MSKLNLLDDNRIILERNWRDNLDQVFVLVFIVVGLIIGFLYGHFALEIDNSNLTLPLIITLVVLLYFLLPTTRAEFDLPNNKWKTAKLAFQIPYKLVSGEIVNISSIRVVEGQSQEKRGISYKSSVEIWDFEEMGEINKHVIFKRSNFSSTQHQTEMKNNIALVRQLITIFQRFNIPIEFQLFRDA